MTNIEYHYYWLHLYVQNGVGVMARINVILRKFGVNIQSIDVSVAEGTSAFSNIVFDLESTRDEHGIGIVMRKLERLIPVVKVEWKKVADKAKKTSRSAAKEFEF
ncbi:hypothetical protein HZA43_04340 [Candidatus Peregrinibacteria bacterium]|nr:hypothetical protein [Candidatus Peregrinibacteria bacterium]